MKKLLDLKISEQVLLAFATVLVTIAAMVAAVQWQLIQSGANSQAMNDGVKLQSRASTIHLLAKDNAIASMVILVTISEDQQNKLAQQITDRDSRIVRELEGLATSLAGSEEGTALLADVKKRHATYVGGVQRIVGLVKAGKQAEATFAADEEMLPMLAPFLAALEALDKRQVELVELTAASNASLITTARWTALALGVLSCVLAVVAGVWLVRSVKAPLAVASQVADRVAQGDLTTPISRSGRSEVAQLLRAMAQMRDSLAHVVRGVRAGAEQVSLSSTEIAQGNQDLSDRTEEQANSLQQTAASMQQLGANVKSNAESSQEANQLARTASDVATRGGEVMGQMVDTMRGINESSRRISDIIGVIDGIAFQTNILALNAAVEAARAGEAGRGFAVVASEVRSLAGRSAEAAKEIKSLISASVERVEHGTALVDQAGETMGQVVEAIARVNQIISEINTASHTQAAEVGDLGQTLNTMDEGTQQNAALVEEMASATSSLSTQAKELVEAVAVFRLEAQTTSLVYNRS